MKRMFISRNSPAIVISILALVAAVAGIAVASTATTSKKGLTPAKVKKIARAAVIKGSFVDTIDFSPLAVNTCQTLFRTTPISIASTDSIIVTPGNISPPIGVVTEAVNNAPAGIAIEACNQTAAVIDPLPGPYRFTLIP